MTSGPDAAPAAGGTVAAGRVADVLLAVADAPRPVGVSELARRLGLSKAVVHRILSSLVDRGLLATSPGRGTYTLGAAAVRIGARALGSLDLRVLALPVLGELQARTGETTTVSALVGTHRIYLDQVVSPQEIRMTVELGVPCPLHAGASGKAILAFADGRLRAAVLAGPLAGLTTQTITGAGALRAELAEIRARGVALSRGERQAGAASVAAPVLGPDGHAIGSVSVCGPRDRLDPAALEGLADAVAAAARRVSDAVAASALTP
ncbi:IclR family transcriptional regulator [Baekduia soli]|uniref:IclR family transcriptional regulator n=1 Tax=Baekduia soli TaxID=496014 RepID=A0A5B8TZH5_9ACTN|nr:IclR family transcriptional regulator [Baekduia soli]QEC46131.1 IclR family transcriptional regulator [Baekduia soli]